MTVLMSRGFSEEEPEAQAGWIWLRHFTALCVLQPGPGRRPEQPAPLWTSKGSHGRAVYSLAAQPSARPVSLDPGPGEGARTSRTQLQSRLHGAESPGPCPLPAAAWASAWV